MIILFVREIRFEQKSVKLGAFCISPHKSSRIHLFCDAFHFQLRQDDHHCHNGRIRKLRWKLWRAGGVDIVLTHAPPHGYGDAPDRAHLGFSCFLPLMEKYRPMYLFHGHVHPNYGYKLPKTQQYADTTIMNVVGWQILDIEPRKREKLPIIGRFRHNK